MRTDLASPFTDILAKRAVGSFPFGAGDDPISTYRSFAAAMQESSASRLVCRIKDPDELNSASKVGLLMADVVILTGAGGKELQMYIPGPAAAPLSVTVPQELASERITVAAVAFSPAVLDPWIEDAREFMHRGRLMYLPDPAIVFHEQEQDGRNRWRAEPASINPNLGAWELAAMTESPGPMVLLSDAHSRGLASQQLSLLKYTLPTLENIPLRELCAISEEEETALAKFRTALKTGATSLLGPTAESASEEAVRKAGITLRTDVIEPEVAALTQALKRITQSRALRVGGAVLGAVGMTLTALTGAGVVAGITGAAATGVGGVLMKELADWRHEVLALREKPWYFAWVLNSRSTQ